MADVIVRFTRANGAAGGVEYNVAVSLPCSGHTFGTVVHAAVADLRRLDTLAKEIEDAIPYYRTNPGRLRELVVELGMQLWHVVFGDDRNVAERLFGEWRICNRPGHLRLLLVSDDPGPLRWPWEYLCDPQSNPPLFPMASLGIRLIRLCEGGQPRPAPVPPLEVAVLASSPTDRPGFNTMWCEKRADDLRRRLGSYASVQSICDEPTVSDMLGCCTQRHVVMFVGHGEYEPSTGQSSLILVSPAGGFAVLPSAQLDSTVLGGCLCRGDSRTCLVVLNACNSARVALHLFQLSKQIPGGSAPTVVAMQFPLPVDAAFRFLQDALDSGCFGGQKTLSGFIADWRQRLLANGDYFFGIPTMFATSSGDQPAGAEIAEHFVKMRTELEPPNPLTLGLDAWQLQLLQEAALGLPPGPQMAVIGAIPQARQRQVQLRPFAIDVLPVTNRLYRMYAGRIGFTFNQVGPDDGPAIVTFREARNYCTSVGGRLPTPDEWEYAARQDDSTVFPGLPDSLRDWQAAMAGAVQAPRSVFDSPQPRDPRWPRDMVGNVGEFTEHQGNVCVKGGLPLAQGAALSALSVACAPSLTYPGAGAAVMCGFRCAYDV